MNNNKLEVNIGATHIRQVDVQVRNLLASVEMSELIKLEMDSVPSYKYTLYFNESQLVDVEKNLQSIASTLGRLTLIVNSNVVNVKQINLKGMM